MFSAIPEMRFGASRDGGSFSGAADRQLAENSRLGSKRENRALGLCLATLKPQTTQRDSWHLSGRTASGPSVYLYDGMGTSVIEEVDGSSNLLARYTQGPAVDQPFAELRSGTTSFYQQDGLGSVTSLGNVAGALANSYSYDSFGKLFASTGTLTNPYQYTGREFDAETGLYYYRARYCDTIADRFITEDPIEFDGGSLNFYVYVGNNPTTLTDPLGLRVLNPNNYAVSGAVASALQSFNKCIGCDKDVVITGGDRPASSNLGAGSNSTHVKHLAADIVVPGQLNILTANQAEQCGGFGGIGWYQEGYRGANGEGPHVHVDLRGSPPDGAITRTGEKRTGTSLPIQSMSTHRRLDVLANREGYER